MICVLVGNSLCKNKFNIKNQNNDSRKLLLDFSLWFPGTICFQQFAKKVFLFLENCPNGPLTLPKKGNGPSLITETLTTCCSVITVSLKLSHYMYILES